MRDNRPAPSNTKSAQDLTNRKILLGVCGGIAAYKAVELCRLFVKAGARVQVVMTKAGAKFVAPLTFETITARHVFIEMFPEHGEISPWHTELASWPDMAVIAPATANHLARVAAGLADDLLSTLMLTLERPRLICPAMNYRMWQNPATQDNVDTLKRRGYRFVMPDEGQMARPGEGEGMGRLTEPDVIFREVCHILSTPQDLRNVRVLVTAGRTEESWDPVRVLTNRASGRMGFALAEEARERGAEVTLVHGPTDVIPPASMRIRRVTTASEMAAAVKQEFPQCRIVLMSAAVADYTFASTAEHKIKKGHADTDMHLVPTEDILRSLSERKGNRIVVGFALETENLLENALKKLREKHLDLVVANNPLALAGESNQVLLIHRSGRVDELPLQSKREIARAILDAVIGIYHHPEPEPEVEPVFEHEELEPLEPDDHSESEITSEPVAVLAPVSANGKASRRGRRRGGRNRRDRQRDRTETPPAAESPSRPESLAVPKVVAQPQPVITAVEATPELPLSDVAVESSSKRGKTRRGGRRARARKAALFAAEGSTEKLPQMEPPSAPVVTAEAAAGTKQDAAKPARKPRSGGAKGAPRGPRKPGPKKDAPKRPAKE